MRDSAIEWDTAGWLGPVVLLSALAGVLMVVLGGPDLVVFAAPLVGALGGAAASAPPRGALRVHATLSAERVFEGEPVLLRVELAAPGGVEITLVELERGSGLQLERHAVEHPAPGSVHAVWELRPTHWGRIRSQLRIEVQDATGTKLGSAPCDVPDVVAFPHADRLTSVPRPADLPDLLGVHLGRRRGAGVEFAGIRGYQPGDPLRAVNWTASARRGSLHVTERLAEQAAKVVTLIDASGDIHQPGGSTLELSVQGALAVVRATLRRGDRAGVVALGGVIRWLSPGLGRRHLYRIVEAVTDVRAGDGAAPSDVSRFPRAVLPLGAVVVVFSPLLDRRVLAVLADLRRRGFPVAVVDVLRAEPRPRPGHDDDALAARMWRIGRRGMHHRLAELGIPVGGWPPGTELEAVLRPMAQRPLLGGGR